MADGGGIQINKTHKDEAAKLFACLTEENQIEFLMFMRALVAQNQKKK